MRRLPLVVTVAAGCLIVSVFAVIQPPGRARIVRRGSQIDVVSRRVAFVAPFGSQSCFAPAAGRRLLFESSFRTGDVVLRVNFSYDAPRSVPDRWPAGDWCTALTKAVGDLVQAGDDEILADPRTVENRISAALQRRLSTDKLITSSVSVRAQLPPGWQRIRPVPEIARLARPARPLIFVGLDGADWELLDDLIAGGAMPNLARLVHDGSSGVLETEHPPLSPLLWTTMMTGVGPLQHQILDFTHFSRSSGAKEPITSDERAVPAIWNMATMAGKRVAVLGLWATHPAEPVNGVIVSDRLFSSSPGAVFPPARERWAKSALAAAEGAIDSPAMQRLLPWLSDREAAELARDPNPYANPPSALRRILVETETLRRLAVDVAHASKADLTIVYIEGTDTIGHVFAPFAAPKQPEVTEVEYERYHQVPELYFRRIDHFLGDLMQAAEGTRAMMMIASDHGFRWKKGRPVALSSLATATAAKWHRNEGMYVIWGPGIEASDAHHQRRGGIRQVCATLLDLCALPRATGAALPSLPFRGEAAGRPVTPDVDYGHFFKPFVQSDIPRSGGEELAKLRALGYIGSGESAAPRPPGTSSTKTAGAYNNAGLILKQENRFTEAIASFQEALKIEPNLASAAWNLSDLLYSRGQDLTEADDLLLRALNAGLSDGSRRVIERAIDYRRSGRVDRSLGLLEGAVARRGEDPELRMFRGRYRVDLHDCSGALEDFHAAQQLRPNDPVVWASAGLAELCLGNRVAAGQSFRRSLEINPNQPVLRRFLSQ